MKKFTAGILATLALAGGSVITAPAAQALPPTYGDGVILASCPGRVAESGRLVAPDGTAHHTARWTLTQTGKNGGTTCLRIYDNARGSHVMGGSIVKTVGSGGAYSSAVMWTTATQGLAVTKSKPSQVDISGSITDRGVTYEIKR